MCPQTACRVLGTQPGNPVQALEAGWPGGGGVGTSNVTEGPSWDKAASVQTQLIPWGFKSHPADRAAWEQVVQLGACGCEGEGPMGRELCSGQGSQVPS